METAMEQFRALLSACVAVSSAASSSKDDKDIEECVKSVDKALGLTAEQLHYWNSLYDDSASGDAISLAQDLALLLASTNVSTNKILNLLRVLLLHPSFHCGGLVRMAHMTFEGLKLTKRWDVLEAISTRLLDIIYFNILSEHSREQAFRFYIEVLVGYQHSAELYEKNVVNLIELAKLFRANSEKSREIVKILLVACAALAHCHRGYEAEAMILRRAMIANFGPHVDRPTAAEAEQLLRSCAWMLPVEKLDNSLPSIEGKWVIDEFLTDHHGSAGSQNAGSVLLKKTTNCFAHEFQATIVDDKQHQKLDLTGYLYQRMPEMQVLMAHPESMGGSMWELEGHWRHIYDENKPINSIAHMGPIGAPTWDCRACTMNNETSATKCTTCGTERPTDANIPIDSNRAIGSNPAPFFAVFGSDLSFMRIKWSRGEQQGVWLARKQTVERTFDLATSLNAANDAMTDCTTLPAYVYFPNREPDKMLILERALLSTWEHTEFSIQLWIRPECLPCRNKPQVVLANGHDFELLINCAGHLEWKLAGGRYCVTSSDAVPFGVFCHVTLLYGNESIALLINGSINGEVTSLKGRNDAGPPAQAVSLFTLGGSFESCESNDKVDGPSCFYGQMLDLRIWSTLIEKLDENYSIRNALSGREAHLLGYYPLVGNSERLLIDLSKLQNHACIFEGFRTSGSTHDGATKSICNFTPVTSVEKVPVTNLFAVFLGKEFFGSGKFVLPDRVNSGLQVNCGTSGAALWRQNSVLVANGFQSILSIAPLTATEVQVARKTVVFAMCEASFWDVAPLLSQGAYLSNLMADDVADPSIRHHDGSVMMVKVSIDAVAPGICMYEIGLYIWSKSLGYPLSRVSGIAGGSSNDPSEIRIQYLIPRRVLSVAIGDVGVVFEAAVDLELALCMEPGSAVRTGLIFPAGKDKSNKQNSIGLKGWTFESFDDNLPKESFLQSVLGNVYASLQPNGRKDEEKNSESELIACTRVSTDGSAITQESYGCQTCGLVHGSRICRSCAIICHDGHELVLLGVTTTVCGCHVRGKDLCRCINPVQISEFPLINRPVHVSFWGCNKCTVINSIDNKQCSVCGNNAPETKASMAPNSISPALASDEQPPPVTNWSCEACTMLNDVSATKCSVCDTVRAKQSELVIDEINYKSKMDNGLTTLYHAAENATNADHVKPISSWTCGACTMTNEASNTTCHMCGSTREGSTETAVGITEKTTTFPSSNAKATSESIPMSMDEGDQAKLFELAMDLERFRLKNIKCLDEFKRAVALKFSQLLENERIRDSVWETTGGKMLIKLDKSFVGEYVHGTYVEKDGILSGLARLMEDGAWKLDGTFKKSSHSQSNACTLYWDKIASRFDGKWYRGDGSGDWKCLYTPYASDFCGLAPVDPVKKPTDLQPFYRGMVNMKQNLANVCYQNSFLQTLYMTQDFRRLILTCDAHNYLASFADHLSTSENVVASIQDLFTQMTASQRPFLATHALQRCLPTEFKNGRQQDASDFAHFLIDALSQHLNQHDDTASVIPSIFGGHQATILACKLCGKKSVNREYFWELLLNMIDLRYTPITSITAVSGSSMDIQTPDGYERLNTDLNKDRTGAPYVYLCVKRCPERVTTDASMEDNCERVLPVTELVVKVALTTDPNPVMLGFERVELDLNVGGGSSAGGKKKVYLFFRRDPNGSPITDLLVVYGNESIPDGFKQIQVDLNQGDGTKVYLCYRCDMPITDLKIVNSGIPGYRMVDHLLNLSHEEPVKQYLALKVGGNELCLTDLKLVSGHDVVLYEEQGWQSIGSPYSSVLPYKSLSDSKIFIPPQLMIRRGHGNPIFAVDVFRAPRQVPKYNDYEVIELFPAESSNDDIVMQVKGDWMGSDDTDRGRKAVRIRSVSEPIFDALHLRGSFEDKGELSCVATCVTSWSESISARAVNLSVPADPLSIESAGVRASVKNYHLSGYWKSAKVPCAQLFNVELRPKPSGALGAADNADLSADGELACLYSLNGTIGDGKGNPIAIQGIQTSRAVKVKWPISSIMVLRGDECVPEGMQVVRETCSGRSANLLAQTTSSHTLFLAVKREEAPANGYITDVCVIYGEIDAIPEHFICIKSTPANYSANLNDGTPGIPIFICYRQDNRIKDASSKYLMDLTLMWTSGAQPDTLPMGYTKIQHTPLGMEANLNQGTSGVAIYLCYSNCEARDIIKPIHHSLNGNYEITSSPLPAFGRFLSFFVSDELEETRVVEGNFGIVLHTHLTGLMSGFLYTPKRQQKGSSPIRTILGAWSIQSPMAGGVNASVNAHLPSMYPFELTLNDAGTEMDGWWSGAEEILGGISRPIILPAIGGSPGSAVPSPVVTGGKWKLVKDSYVHVAFKKDYSTEWKDGQLVFSERVWRHDIESMLSRFVATRTLGGDNALLCDVCQKKTESRTHTVIFEPPEHLIITLKRMYYDWNQQKACKYLHDVRFPTLLSLPSLTEEEENAVYGHTDDESPRVSQQNKFRHYGLYGVLVHSGLTANSGHYFSFCRESDESTRQLHLEDSPLSPWIKFNDTKVERSSWKEINRLVSNTVSDTVYLLLYRKLSYNPRISGEGSDVLEGVTSDDEEAMLLAKAMALSMSASRHHRHEAENKCEVDDLNGVDDFSMLSTNAVAKTLLKKVENENATFLREIIADTSSALHADDLHTLLVLRHSIPLRLRAILDEIC
ncbi:putative Zinc finger, RanBP2-type, Zinc finger, UBR-type, ubiquitin specific protease, MABP [Plasmopara halstedii]